MMQKKKDLLIAFVINLIWVMGIRLFFHSFFESNDDVAMAYFVEGAYGQPSSYLVFQNIVIGKIMSSLTYLLPTVKWYAVVYFAFMCGAYTAISYVMIRIRGRVNGIVSTIFVIIFLGYQTYVIVQFTRVAAIVSTGGLVLLFWCIEYAETKAEKIICGICGMLLTLLGSMIRFRMFCICVLFFAVLGLVRLFFMIKEERGFYKRLVSYAVIFGSMLIIVFVFRWTSGFIYDQSGDWKEYSEYNELRSELWDYGFPDYAENEELYERLGISYSDLKYYLTWNMDVERLDMETLRQLVEAKPPKQLSVDVIKSFLELYPKAFFPYSLFWCYVVIAVLSVIYKPRNAIVVILQLITVMTIEFYLYFQERYGLPRIDVCLWMAPLITVLYLIPQNSGKLKRMETKLGIAATIIILALNAKTFSNDISSEYPDRSNFKNFFRMISENEKDLYVFTMESGDYRLSKVYNFWEVSQRGIASNVYHTGGWEIKCPITNSVLETHDVTNIYKDSIDNPHIYFVSMDDAEITEAYIQRHYNPEAKFCLVNEIDGQAIYQIKTTVEE